MSTLLFFFFIGLLVYILLLANNYAKYRKSQVSFDVKLPPLTAYAWPHAYTTGDTVQLRVHASGDYLGTVYRVAQQKYPVIAEFSGTVRQQNPRYHLKTGHQWEVTDEISTLGWQPGFYLVQLGLVNDSTTVFNVPVLLRSRMGNRVLVVAPTNTWQAYNQHGGKSNYRDSVTPRELKAIFSVLERVSPGLVPYNYLPAHRPFDQPISVAPIDGDLPLLNGKISSDLYLIEYLEALGIDYGIISDREVESGAIGTATSLLIFNNHSEYWSYAGMGVVKNYLEQGGNVAFLSGNNMFREVESVANEALIVLEQHLPRATAEPILGTFYSESGYDTFGSFQVMKQGHWLFDGTGLSDGDTFGNGIISGVETDKLGPYSEGFTLLAVGDNTSGGAHMVIKEFPTGNFLFNSSSISSVRALRTDEAWRMIVHNLLRASGTK